MHNVYMHRIVLVGYFSVLTQAGANGKCGSWSKPESRANSVGKFCKKTRGHESTVWRHTPTEGEERDARDAGQTKNSYSLVVSRGIKSATF